MDIATIIITSLTLIAVGVGLFLNHKTNLKLAGQLKDFEEKTNQSISASRAEILDIVKVHKEENSKQLDEATKEITKLLVDKSEQINTSITESIGTICKTINSNITSTIGDLVEAFENKSNKSRDEIINSTAKLQKETAETIEARLKSFQLEIQSKIDASSKNQEKQLVEALANMDDKFQKVINEIKSPLALD